MEALHIDFASLGIGVLIGFISSILMKLKSLKNLGLKLDRIGLDLGVEGFDSLPSGNSITNSTVSAGSDVVLGNKHSDSSKFYQNLNKIVQSSIKQEEKFFYSSFSEEIVIANQELREKITQIRSGRMNLKDYTSAFFENREFLEIIKEKVSEFKVAGWAVEGITFDNTFGGIHINFKVKREFP
jgi:hypothetical protein